MPELPRPNRDDDVAPITALAQDAPYYYTESNVMGRFMEYSEARSLKLNQANTGGGGWRNKEGTQFFMREIIDHTMYRDAEAQYAYINGNTYYIKINMTLETAGDQFVAWHAELQVKNIHAGRGDLQGDMEKIKAFYRYACTFGQMYAPDSPDELLAKMSGDPFQSFKSPVAGKFASKWPDEEAFAKRKETWGKNVSTLTFVQL